MFGRTGAVVAAANDYTFAQVSTANNAIPVAKIAAGLAGQYVGGTTPAYSYPPGKEYARGTFTAPVSTTSTTPGTATTVVTTSSLTADGATEIEIRFNASLSAPTIAGDAVYVELFEDATDLGIIATFDNGASAGGAAPCYGSVIRTPGAGAHTYTAKIWVDGGTGVALAGTGGSGVRTAGYLVARQT